GTLDCLCREIPGQGGQAPPRDGGNGMLQPGCATSCRNQKAEKHADRRHHGLRVASTMTPGPGEDKVTQGSRVILYRLLTKRLQEIEKGQSVVVQSSCHGPTVGEHPVTKLNEEQRCGSSWWAQGWRRRVPRRGQERDKVTCAQKEMPVVATGIVQAPLAVQVMPKGCKRLPIQGLDGEPSMVCPAREAVHPSQEVEDTVRLISTRFQPVRELFEVGTRRADTVALQCQRRFEIGGQHAALLQWSP